MLFAGVPPRLVSTYLFALPEDKRLFAFGFNFASTLLMYTLRLQIVSVIRVGASVETKQTIELRDSTSFN